MVYYEQNKNGKLPTDPYIFVGNHRAEKDLLHLHDVEHYLGKQAYDIYGEKIDPTIMLPLFIKRTDCVKYEAIMNATSPDRLAQYLKEAGFETREEVLRLFNAW